MRLLFEVPNVEQKTVFQDQFLKELAQCSEARLLSGFISEISVADLAVFCERNSFYDLDLIVGMHWTKGITRPQWSSLCRLQHVLNSGKGKVLFAKEIPIHAKVYSFKSNTRSILLVGSSNLSALAESGRHVLEADFRIESDSINAEFTDKLRSLYSGFIPIDQILPEQLKFLAPKEKSESPVKILKTSTSFRLPLKSFEEAEKSNLHCYNGAPRTSSNGRDIPRSWYEIELIVPASITRHPKYPKTGKVDPFHVVTDDGLEFECFTGGQGFKNLRSKGGLTIIGYWLKNRLINAGLLESGERITTSVLTSYGRSDIEMTLLDDGRWLFDFSRD